MGGFQCGSATCRPKCSSRSIRATRRFVDAFRRGGIFGELFGRSSRPGDELSAAVRTLPLEDIARAGAAERAFKRADDRVGGLWRQVTVTAFAIWTELQHSRLSFCTGLIVRLDACVDER